MGDAIPTGDTRAARTDPTAPFDAAGLAVLPLQRQRRARRRGLERRRQPAPRIPRGGAGWLYPRQECGEGQPLSNAVRSHSDGWDGRAVTRPALGVVPRRD